MEALLARVNTRAILVGRSLESRRPHDHRMSRDNNSAPYRTFPPRLTAYPTASNGPTPHPRPPQDSCKSKRFIGNGMLAPYTVFTSPSIPPTRSERFPPHQHTWLSFIRRDRRRRSSPILPRFPGPYLHLPPKPKAPPKRPCAQSYSSSGRNEIDNVASLLTLVRKKSQPASHRYPTRQRVRIMEEDCVDISDEVNPPSPTHSQLPPTHAPPPPTPAGVLSTYSGAPPTHLQPPTSSGVPLLRVSLTTSASDDHARIAALEGTVNQLAASMTTNMAELFALLRGPNRASSSSTPPSGQGPTADPTSWFPPTQVPENTDVPAPPTTHTAAAHPFTIPFPPPPAPAAVPLPLATFLTSDQVLSAPPPVSMPAPAADYTVPPPMANEARPDASYGDCSLFPGMRLPSKFKIPEFKTYEGTTDPRHHLRHYRGKMLRYWEYEEFVIHSFQDSLSGSALDWFMSLKAEDIPTWADLSRKFIDQYQMEGPTNKGEEPSKKASAMSTSSSGRKGKEPTRVPPPQGQQGGAAQPHTRRQYPSLPVPLSHIYRQICDKIGTIAPDPNFDLTIQDRSKQCEYHRGAPGHTLNNCWKLRERIQEMIDAKEVTFNAVKSPNASDYKVAEQMAKSPTHISLLALLLSSEPHREALLRVLTAAQVPKGTSPDRIEETINSIFSNTISFSDDELPSEGCAHSRALHIVCKCSNHIVGRVMIDNGSALNVCPVTTLKQMNVDLNRVRPSKTAVRAFDDSRREVNGEIDLLIDVGPCSFSLTFQVLDIPNAFSLLLGRPWIHLAETAVPYISVGNDENLPFHSFETISVIRDYGEAGPSRADRMIGKVLLRHNYILGTGLRAREQGINRPIEVEEYKHKRGLGFRPSCHEIVEARKGNHLHRLAMHYGRLNRGMQVPPLSHFFPGPPLIIGSTLDGPSSDFDDTLDALPTVLHSNPNHRHIDSNPSEECLEEPEPIYFGEGLDKNSQVPEIEECLCRLEDHQLTSLEPTEEVNVGTKDEPRTLKIGTGLDPTQRARMVDFLTRYQEVFAWSYADMPGLDPSIVKHFLPLDTERFPPKRQQLRRQRASLLLRIKGEVVKQINAGFLEVCNYSEWVENIVPLRLNPTKCTFGIRSGKLLGFVVSERGIEVDPDKVKAIRELPPPSSVREVRGFFGRLNYIARLIANLTDKCRPLFRLLRKNAAVEWSEECQKAFDTIKAYLVQPPVLVPLTPGRPLVLYLTVRRQSLGCMLGQEEESTHTKHAIYHLSKKFTDGESNYPEIEKMCYALIDFPCTNNVAEYEACILGLQAAIDFKVKELEVFGDSMLTIFQTLGQWKTKDAKLVPYHEYLERLTENFEDISFTYTPRMNNQFADALATLASMVSITKENLIEPLEIEIAKGLAHCNAIEASEAKPWYKDIKNFLRTGQYPPFADRRDRKSLRRLAIHYFLSGEILYRCSFDSTLLRCIDEHESRRLMEEVCAHPNFILSGTHARSLCDAAWECLPSRGHATDTPEKDSTLGPLARRSGILTNE
ncbi:hypothetical protein CRG98_015702 [Punica granatum]|uniref:G-patch domain-containing protein n=1 Tax=Punica granatum TaxID=22663 RepID=A0A2I0K5V5_PUNGR|nr:hypothetical protein CRG98_015702 [Punica granatum]